LRGFYLTAAASNSDSRGDRRGGGNGVDNACGACGRQCGDSVYCTYDYYYGDVLHQPASLHLLFELPLLYLGTATCPAPSHGVSFTK
jgi:hypothetical protein